VGDLVSEVLDILGDEAGHFPILGMAPTVLDSIEFRCIRRSVCDRDTGAITRLEETSGFAMPTPTIPDDEQGVLQMPVELLDKGKDIIAHQVPRDDREIEA
jgi:hypothetical protein